MNVAFCLELKTAEVLRACVPAPRGQELCAVGSLLALLDFQLPPRRLDCAGPLVPCRGSDFRLLSSFLLTRSKGPGEGQLHWKGFYALELLIFWRPCL